MGNRGNILNINGEVLDQPGIAFPNDGISMAVQHGNDPMCMLTNRKIAGKTPTATKIAMPHKFRACTRRQWFKSRVWH